MSGFLSFYPDAVEKLSLEGNAFEATVASGIRQATAADACVIFLFKAKTEPTPLYFDFSTDQAEILVDEYCRAPYKLDPFYQIAETGSTGVWRLDELGSRTASFRQYLRSYYAQAKVVSEVAYIVALEPGMSACVSLMDFGPACLPERERMSILYAELPMVSALFRERWRQNHCCVTCRLSSEKSSIECLTGREQEIVNLLRSGHSTKSIALNLAISAGTVMVHRRNIYRKLSISSVVELVNLAYRRTS